jgi:transcription antitermination factor NusG
MPDWALATTPPNAERLVSIDLARWGYSHWIFQRSTTRAYRGRVVENLRPAFPRYVLVPFEQCWNVLHDVWRVLGIVCFGEEVARVRERDVDKLIKRCARGNVLPSEPVLLPFAQGERVHVGGVGLISGHDAIFQNVVDDGRVRVLFNMMGALTPIDVDQRDVFSIVRKQKRRRGRRRKANPQSRERSGALGAQFGHGFHQRSGASREMLS